MRKLPFIFLLVLIFCASVFAQTNERPTCPNVDVADAPQGVGLGGLVTFSADINTFVKEYDLKYYWHVNEEAGPRGSLRAVIEL